MSEQTNRRKDRFFGFPLDISVKWLVIIVVMGLIQFGVFWEQFRALNDNVVDMKNALSSGATTAQTLIIKDALQDAKDISHDTEIMELKRRTRKLQ
jgi:hypothetical protein